MQERAKGNWKKMWSLHFHTKGTLAGTVIESFRTLPREKIMRRFTPVSDPTCAPFAEKAIVGMQTFGGTRKGEHKVYF